MRRPAPRPVALALLVALVALAPVAFAPVAAHDLNHLSADAQVSADGTVVLESAYATEDGFVVLYRGWNGTDGEVVGVERFSAARQDVTEVSVAVDEAVWSAWPAGESTELTAVLHADSDDDGEFDADDDFLVSFGRATQATIPVRKGSDAVYVSTATIGPQRVTDAVTIRAVSIAEAGHVVLRRSEGGQPGRVVGSVALDAGVHRSVTVPVNRSALSGEGPVAVYAVAYSDDGDGTLDAGDDPVRANGTLVATRFSVTVGEGTPTAAVVTPTATPSPSPTPSPTVGAGVTPTDSPTESASGGDGAGMGAAVAVVGIAAFLLGRRRRR